MKHLSLSPKSVPRWNAHKAAWKDCQRCPLSATRKRVVLVRGFIPADVVFLGEAPGGSEDALGIPFVGPSGKLLDTIVAEAFATVPEAANARHAFINVMGCFPFTDTDTASAVIRKPTAKEIKACQPRVVDVLEILCPRVLFTVGQIAKSHLPPTLGSFLELPPYHVTHPAALLRMKPEEQGLGFKRAVGNIVRGLRDCFNT